MLTPIRHLLHRIAALLLGLLVPFIAPTMAQEERPPAPRPSSSSAPVQPAYPALWKVADKDTTIYLFGTIHALPKGIDWFGGPVAAAFDRSQELVTEIVESDPAQMQKLVMEKALLPQGQTLRALLAPETRGSYEGALGTLGVSAGAFDAFEPWYAAIGLATLPLVRQGYDNANGVETALDAKARALGRTHSALETPEFQLGLFDSLPLDVQKRYLAEVVSNLPHASDDLAAMVDAWRKGDAERLASLMNADEDDPALIAALLTNRNRVWAGWVRDRLARPGTVFVAVGAGHLAGPGSVQDQLAGLGIASTRVQ